MEAGGIADEHPTLCYVVHVADRGAVAQRRDRQPEQLTEFDDLLDGPFGHPGADLFANEIAVCPPADLETQLFDLLELRAFDHRGEVEPLLTGDHGDPDVAVLGRFDRGHFESAADRRHLKQLRMQPFAALHQGDRLEHGQVEMLTGTAVLDAAAHRQRAECGEHATHVLPQVAADRNRWPCGITAKSR